MTGERQAVAPGYVIRHHAALTHNVAEFRALPQNEKLREPNPFDFYVYEALWWAELGMRNIERAYPCLTDGTCVAEREQTSAATTREDVTAAEGEG